jgi:DNA-binding transcriptional MerR regulator
VAAPVYGWCAGLAEYRLDDLARISGVSSRNIRAYRERGLLDPPRRQGRSAYYDDVHLSQLKTINQLLRKGYNSAHISEFFARMREGHDLAAILGVEEAAPSSGGDGGLRGTPALDLDPASDEAQRLVSNGLARVAQGSVVLVHPEMAEIVARSANQQSCVRMILRVAESGSDTINELAAALVTALEEAVTARFGADHVPAPDEMAEMAALIDAHRDLGVAVVTHVLDEKLRNHMRSSHSVAPAENDARRDREPAGS